MKAFSPNNGWHCKTFFSKMRHQILLNSSQQLLDFDTAGNLKSSRDFNATVFVNQTVYAVKNILHANQTKKAFKVEITALTHGYGLLLVGFKSGEFFGCIMNQFDNSASDPVGTMLTFNGPVTKIEIFGPRIAVSTTNEMIIMNNQFNIVKKMSMITRGFQLKSKLYLLDLSSLRIFNTQYEEVETVLGRFTQIAVNTIGDTVFLVAQQSIIRLHQGAQKELDTGENIIGLCFTADEKLLIAWSAQKALVVNVENFVILQELYTGDISGIVCNLLPRSFNKEHLALKRKDYCQERMALLKKFKPSTELAKQNQDLLKYSQDLAKLNDELIAQLKAK